MPTGFFFDVRTLKSASIIAYGKSQRRIVVFQVNNYMPRVGVADSIRDCLLADTDKVMDGSRRQRQFTPIHFKRRLNRLGSHVCRQCPCQRMRKHIRYVIRIAQIPDNAPCFSLTMSHHIPRQFTGHSRRSLLGAAIAKKLCRCLELPRYCSKTSHKRVMTLTCDAATLLQHYAHASFHQLQSSAEDLNDYHNCYKK